MVVVKEDWNLAVGRRPEIRIRERRQRREAGEDGGHEAQAGKSDLHCEKEPPVK